MLHFQEFGFPIHTPVAKDQGNESLFVLIQEDDIDDPDVTVEEYIEEEQENWKHLDGGPTTYEIVDNVHVVRFYQEIEGEKVLNTVLKITVVPDPED